MRKQLLIVSGKSALGLLAGATLALSLSSIADAKTNISGSPANTVVEGQHYAFQIVASDTDYKNLVYSIKNKPDWATFDTWHGKLWGNPTASDVGTYSNIVVTAGDGVSSASLPAFTITVTKTASSTSGGGSTGAATIDWTPPTSNTNGSSLTNLAGYKINYGTSSSSLSKTISVGTGLSSYTVTDLAAGTYYFAVVAYNSAGVQSALSKVVSKTVK